MDGIIQLENNLFLDYFRAADCGLGALPLPSGTCETRGARATFSSFELAGGEVHGIALSLVGYEEIEPIPRIHCRTRLTRHIRPMGSCQAPFLLFDCIQILEVLLFVLFSVEEVGADCYWSNQPEMT